MLKAWREYLGRHHGVEWFTAEPASLDVPPALSRWKDRQYEREQMEAAGFTPTGPLELPHCRCRSRRTRGDDSAIFRGHAPLRPGQPEPASDDREGLGHLDHWR